MKKFAKKLVLTLVTVIAVVCISMAFAACGSAEKKVTGSYCSDNSYRWMNMLPTYNYYTLTYQSQQIETYDDGTYCLTVNAITYSNVNVGESVPTGSATGNDRGNVVTRYYGTCTAETDSEGDITLNLAKPTRVVRISKGSLTIDTANWVEDMAKSIVDGQGNQAMDKDGNPYTAETYLANILGEFTGAEVYVNGTTYIFSQVSI